MEIGTIQHRLRQAGVDMASPFRSGAELVVAITEELGEVATEVSLLEQIGAKAHWSRDPSTERLADEMLHLLNFIFTLANRYEIDLDREYVR